MCGLRSSRHFSKLDSGATIDKTRSFLQLYQDYHRIERRDIISLRSPSYDGMPKAPHSNNAQEDKVVDHLSAAMICRDVRNAIDALEDWRFRYIINHTFIKSNDLIEIQMDELGVSRTRYSELKNEALIAFAEIYPPMLDENGKPDDLMVFKGSEIDAI